MPTNFFSVIIDLLSDNLFYHFFSRWLNYLTKGSNEMQMKAVSTYRMQIRLVAVNSSRMFKQ
ncbi:hypothetical protein Plhal304r1_c061g0148881 [Plasmopara halstedii]